LYIPIVVLVVVVIVFLLYSHGKAQAVTGAITVAGARLDDLIALQTREALAWYGQLRARAIEPRVDAELKAEAQRLIGAIEGAANARLPYRTAARTINHMLAPEDIIDELDDAEEKQEEQEDDLHRLLDQREAELRTLRTELNSLRTALDAGDAGRSATTTAWADSLKACDDCRDCARCAEYRRSNTLGF